MTFTGVAVASAKFLSGMWYCTVDSDIGTDDFSLVLRILHVCGHVHVRSHLSPSMLIHPVVLPGLSVCIVFATRYSLYRLIFRLKRTSPTAYCDCWEKCACKALIPGEQESRVELLKKLLSETDLATKPNKE